jgi:hypothetical protein
MALLGTCLAGCQTAGLRTPAVALPEDQAQTDGVLYRLDPAASELHFLVYRDGPLARLGHNHVIAARNLDGEVVVSADRRSATFTLLLAVDDLAVDPAPLRERYGADFSSTPSDADIAGTRSNMLSAALLDATAFPYVRVAGRLDRTGGGDMASLEIAVKDTLAQRTVPVAVQLGDDTLTAQATLSIDHAELGLTPFSVMLGALRVAPTIDVTVSLAARRAAGR